MYEFVTGSTRALVGLGASPLVSKPAILMLLPSFEVMIWSPAPVIEAMTTTADRIARTTIGQRRRRGAVVSDTGLLTGIAQSYGVAVLGRLSDPTGSVSRRPTRP